MNLTNAVLQQNIYAIHYVDMDIYTGKKLKSYTGKETFSSMDDVNMFLFKNGYKPFDGFKYDMELRVGSLTTYTVIKQFELYSY